jgi:hypothetical protein
MTAVGDVEDEVEEGVTVFVVCVVEVLVEVFALLVLVAVLEQPAAENAMAASATTTEMLCLFIK